MTESPCKIHITQVTTHVAWDTCVEWTLAFRAEGIPTASRDTTDLFERLAKALETALFHPKQKDAEDVARIIEFNKRLAQFAQERKERTSMIDTMQILRNFDRDAVGLDELVALTATGNILKTAYAEYGLSVPDWLTESLRAVKHEVEERSRDFKVRDLAVLRAKLESKRSETQTAADIEAKIATLSAELGE